MNSGHSKRYEVPKTEIMKRSQEGRSGEIRPRSGHINCKQERLRINQQYMMYMTYLWITGMWGHSQGEKVSKQENK